MYVFMQDPNLNDYNKRKMFLKFILRYPHKSTLVFSTSKIDPFRLNPSLSIHSFIIYNHTCLFESFIFIQVYTLPIHMNKFSYLLKSLSTLILLGLSLSIYVNPFLSHGSAGDILK